jgi:hypothetical protein
VEVSLEGAKISFEELKDKLLGAKEDDESTTTIVKEK